MNKSWAQGQTAGRQCSTAAVALFVPLLEKQITIIILTTISGICASVERNKMAKWNSTQPSSTSETCQRTHKQPHGRVVDNLRRDSGAGPQLWIFCNLCCRYCCWCCFCCFCSCCWFCCLVERLAIIHFGLTPNILPVVARHSQTIISDTEQLLPSDFVNLITNQLTQGWFKLDYKSEISLEGKQNPNSISRCLLAKLKHRIIKC